MAPFAIEGLTGVTVIDTRVAAVTVSVVDPDMLPDKAVIVVVPAASEAAAPWEPVPLLIVAMFVDEELQITDAVKSCVVLSE